MNDSTIVLGAPQWLGWAMALAGLGLAVAVWAYVRSGSTPWVRAVAFLLKSTGLVALALCLVEPRLSKMRPRPGSNLFLVVADNSRSLQLSDSRQAKTRGQEMLARLAADSPWLARLGQDFDVRRYAFDTSLHAIADFSGLTFDGQASDLGGSLTALGERLSGRAVAGVLLLTDGNSTDIADKKRDWSRLPPIFPVALGRDTGLIDLSVSRVTVSQTNFEASPVTIAAEVRGQGVSGRGVVVRVLDEAGEEVERRTTTDLVDGEPASYRFLLRPERPGISFYTIQVCLDGEAELLAHSEKSAEATLANNRRIATVDRGGGPYRVLYVSGRPNWEFKFLKRALEEDDELALVALVRIARREPKFKFLGRSGERTNPLFRGFGNQPDEEAEGYDEPVLLRLGTADHDELRGGFPKSVEELFRYHAVILDEIEADFFTPDQQSLLQQFVSRRGGGFLMLGGHESFVDGGYRRTAIGEMLPVYLDRVGRGAAPGVFRMQLTREGWLQPWVRLRSDEQEETQRVAAMPGFKTLNHVETIKPGATVLAQVESVEGVVWPALVVHQFGRGRPAAMLLGDLWRWNLRRPLGAESDLEKSWRQTIRWLTADVPRAVEVETKPAPGSTLPAVQIVVRAADKQFEPLDNATVTLAVTTPDQRRIELEAESSGSVAGEYAATFAPRTAGIHRAQVTVTGPDGTEVGRRALGWAVEPDTEEFQSLAPNRPLLARLAKETGGEVVAADDLESFVASLPDRRVPVVEPWTDPLWHKWSVFLLAIACFTAEWGPEALEGPAMTGKWCFAIAWLLGSGGAMAAEPGHSVVVVVGAAGADEYGGIFETCAGRWAEAARLGHAEFATIGLDEPAPATDYDRLRERLAAGANSSGGVLWLILIGHGTFDGQTARFNLRGPDVTAGELAAWLKPVERPLAIVNCASASAPFLAELSAPGRIVMTATKSGFEQNFARFGECLSTAIVDPAADLDKDEQTSLLEAFLLASAGVREFYARDGRLETEHALLDDNGDRLGTRAAWFQGVRVVKTAKKGAAPDGVRAGKLHLIASAREERLSDAARERRDELESELAQMRTRKSELPEDEYLALIEPLLVQLAKLYEEPE